MGGSGKRNAVVARLQNIRDRIEIITEYVGPNGTLSN